MANTKSSIQQSVNSKEYSNPVDALTFKIFNIFDVFRGQNYYQDNTQIVLLLVSLYKDGVIKQELLSDDFTVSRLYDSILESDLSESKKKLYLSVTQILSDSLANIIRRSNSFLSLYLYEIEHDLLLEYFPAVFDDTIYRIAQFQGKNTAGNIQPIELTSFLSKLVNLKANARVFNPFAGLASFGINLENEQEYFGQEINQSTWILGILRLMAHGKLSYSHFERKDSIEEWPIDSKFDLIISNPPLGMRIDIRDNLSNSNFKSVEHFLIEKGIQSLSVGGKMLVVLSQSILFKGGSEQELRKQLVEKDLIDTIISFPGGLFPHTTIPFVAMVLSKDKKSSNKVRFIKADNYVVEKNRREKILHEELLLNVYNSDIDFSDDIRLIENEVLRANDYNLSVNRYFDLSNEGIIPDGFSLVNLGDIITIKRGERTDLKSGRVVKVSDLSTDAFNYEKSSTEFEVAPLNNVFQKIESDVLIVSRIKTLRPTLIKSSQDEPIFVNNNIVAFSINIEKVDVGYLIYELNSERIYQYIISRMSGIAMPILSVKDMLNIPILLPDLPTQKNIIKNALNEYQSIKIKELGVELEELKYSLKQEYEKKIRFRKHAIGQEIFDLKNTFKLIMKVKGLNNGQLNDDMIINPSTKSTIKSYFESMSRTINTIRGMVDNIAEDYFYGADEDIDVISFIQEYCNDNNGINFSMKLSHNYYIAEEDEYMPDIRFSDSDDELDAKMDVVGEIMIAKKGEIVSPPKIKISPTSFKQILSNLRNNAIKHGFNDDKRNDYKINIDVCKGKEGNVLISISNNGAPLKMGMTEDSFFINDRQGNIEIKNRVEHANGKLKLEADPGAEFPVKVILDFKDISISTIL